MAEGDVILFAFLSHLNSTFGCALSFLWLYNTHFYMTIISSGHSAFRGHPASVSFHSTAISRIVRQTQLLGLGTYFYTSKNAKHEKQI
jgi:hypothetical protein